jgi:hypothetical protein
MREASGTKLVRSLLDVSSMRGAFGTKFVVLSWTCDNEENLRKNNFIEKLSFAISESRIPYKKTIKYKNNCTGLCYAFWKERITLSRFWHG